MEIILLFKKGNKEMIDNYRPISLTSNITKIIKERIYNQLNENQGREQAGFRKDFSTIDQIFTVRQLLEKAKEYQIGVYLRFIDFKKAYDSITRISMEITFKLRLWSKWTANSNKKLKVNKPCMTSRKTEKQPFAFFFSYLDPFVI